MGADDIFKAIGQWGLPMVATVVLAWVLYKMWKYYEDKLVKQAEAFQKKEEAWALKLEELNEALLTRAESYGDRMFKAQEVILGMTSKNTEILAQAAQREKELRDEAKAWRDSSAGHPPYRGPIQR